MRKRCASSSIRVRGSFSTLEGCPTRAPNRGEANEIPIGRQHTLRYAATARSHRVLTPSGSVVLGVVAASVDDCHDALPCARYGAMHEGTRERLGAALKRDMVMVAVAM